MRPSLLLLRQTTHGSFLFQQDLQLHNMAGLSTSDAQCGRLSSELATKNLSDWVDRCLKLRDSASLEARWVPGDGLCQFHALALAAEGNRRWSDNLLDRSRELRQLAIAELGQNRERYQAFFTAAETDAASYDEYLEKLQSGVGRGSHLTLEALTQCGASRMVSICVHTRGNAPRWAGVENYEGPGHVALFLDNPGARFAHYWAIVD